MNDFVAPPMQNRKIGFFPLFEDSETLTDHYYRAAWYLHPFIDQIESVTLFALPGCGGVGEPPDYLDPKCARLAVKFADKLRVVETGGGQAAQSGVEDCDQLILWRSDPARPRRVPDGPLAGSARAKPCVIADHRNERYAGSLYLKIAESFGAYDDQARSESHRRFETFARTSKSEKIYLFGTGPMLGRVMDHDFSDGLTIACNSMVKNKALLERLQPSLFVIGDPIFHAGCASYAGAFRRHLCEALDAYPDALLIAPARDHHIYARNLPRRFQDRLVSVPFVAQDEPNLDLVESFHVTTTANILTLLLLPIGAALGRKISIAGCDGRPLEEDSYFWSHDKESQINEEMEAIRAAHPAFFDIQYNDYYEEHVATLQKWIESAEAAGRAVETLTPSHIPALKVRHTRAADQIAAEEGGFEPAVSIIMPAHNEEAYITEAIESVRAQKFPDFELIVVNDRSEDRTVEIVEAFMRKDPRIRMAHSDAPGVSSARNKGLSVSRGKYVGFLDSDDLCYADSLRRRLEAISQPGAPDMVHGMTEFLGPEGNVLGLDFGVPAEVTFKDMHSMPTHLNATLCRGELARAHRFNPDLSNAEDWQYFADLLRSGATSRFVPGAKAAYRIHGQSTVLRDIDVHESATAQVLDHIYSASQASNVSELWRDGLAEPSRDIVNAKRLLPTIVTLGLQGRPDIAANIISEIDETAARRAWTENRVRAVTKLAAIRHYKLPIEQVPAAAHEMRDRIRKGLQESGLCDLSILAAAAVAEVLNVALPDWVYERARNEIVKTLPVRAEICLPTERISKRQQAVGLQKVQRLYGFELDEIDRPRLRDIKETMKGRRRCFIIGNGPSLNKTDLSKLDGEVTFAMNSFFLKMPELQWTPTYYVVEDHLVAEDRAKEINKLRGPTKFFPANLAYCLERDADTVFYDHRPRKSYPHGFDFSLEADQITYAGGTVTFSCLQLAAYMGFEEIYLIGVDASYAMPKDAQFVGGAGVKEIDMASDDPNHFHPDYFGKGLRWHEPNVDKMLSAYEEARKVCSEAGQQIYNATKGGQLEVFPRRDYDKLFKGKQRSGRNENLRMLLIDRIPMGGGAATGELKSAIFGDWPAGSILQMSQDFSAPGSPISLSYPNASSSLAVASAELNDAMREAVRNFDPHVILYRPVPEAENFHRAAMDVIEDLNTPHCIWMMDDWPVKLEAEPNGHALEADLRRLLKTAHVNYAISEPMSEAFGERYGVGFKVLHNGVRPRDWPEMKPASSRRRPLRIRYSGSLSPDTTLESVLEAARAVESLASDEKIVLEIRTQMLWHRRYADRFAGMKHVKLEPATGGLDAYRKWLSQADLILLAYNFDDQTRAYLKYSFANKAPECLASGAPVLSYGPPDITTLRRLSEAGVTEMVSRQDENGLKAALQNLIKNPDRRDELASAGRKYAFTHFDLERSKETVIQDLRTAGGVEGIDLRHREFPASVKAKINEPYFVYVMLAAHRNPGVMIDVGAHYGSSLAPFAKAAAEWRIYGFEPDPDNREMLLKRFGEHKNVSVFTEAVSDTAGEDVSFYTSPISTGISGLAAFHETHTERVKVTTVTLDEFVAREDIEDIDFLKIDVEGHEMSVLKGLDFNKFKPRAVLAEFEDAKTKPHGYDSHDLAHFLTQRGYTVFVSEWHPIVQYGVSHSWRRLRLYPCNIPETSWGNLIAFRDVGPAKEFASLARAALAKSVNQDISYPVTPSVSEAEPEAADLPPVSARERIRQGYVRTAERLIVQRPIVARVLRFGLWSLRSLARRPLGIGGAALLSVAGPLLLFAAFPSLWLAWLLLFLAGAGGVAGFLILGYVQTLFVRFAQSVEGRQARLDVKLRALEKEIASLKNAPGADFQARFQALQAELKSTEMRLLDRMKK